MICGLKKKGLPDLADKNLKCLVKFEFQQIQEKQQIILLCKYAPCIHGMYVY